jgi:hypothetical protein
VVRSWLIVNVSSIMYLNDCEQNSRLKLCTGLLMYVSYSVVLIDNAYFGMLIMGFGRGCKYCSARGEIQRTEQD